MAWFVKQERFLRAYAEMKPHLAAHREWVVELRRQGVVVSSGYLVDGLGRPGGGGLLLLQAASHAEAEALVRSDPMVASGCVDWQLQGWIAAVGDLACDLPGPSA